MTTKPDDVLKAALAWFVLVQGNAAGLWLYAGSDALLLGQYGSAAGAYVLAAVNTVLLIAGWRKFR